MVIAYSAPYNLLALCIYYRKPFLLQRTDLHNAVLRVLKHPSTPFSLSRGATVSFDPNLTQKSLPYDGVEHPPLVGIRLYARLLPLSDGACLSTGNEVSSI